MDHQWAVLPRKWAQDVVSTQVRALGDVWGGFLGPRVSLQSELRAEGEPVGFESEECAGLDGGTHGAPGGGHLGHHHPTIAKIIARPGLRINCPNTMRRATDKGVLKRGVKSKSRLAMMILRIGRITPAAAGNV